jgi:hypothetical protein
MSRLVESYLNFENIVITTPKKYTDYLVSKIKYNGKEEFVVQFPKMTISDDVTEKNIELEFINTKGYNKEVYNFLRNLDQFILKSVQQHSQEWFEKSIPIDSLKKMYNGFVKSPQTTENRSTVNFAVSTKRSVFFDKKGNEIDYSRFERGEIAECIAQFKYIFYSKDTCFPVWELVSTKLHKRVEKVPDFGFVDDPDDQREVESDDEDLKDFKFF